MRKAGFDMDINDDDFTPLCDMTRRTLTDLQGSFLHLHKVLLEMERRDYERTYGRVSPGELLKLLLQHQQFAWLRILSRTAVSIEELLDDKEAAAEGQAQDLLTQVRSLLVPDDAGGDFARNYYLALQRDPDAVLAHRAVRQVLTAAAQDSRRNPGSVH